VIGPGKKDDFDEILTIINDAASAYKDVIPGDRWHDPYMSKQELQGQFDEGVQFWCYRKNNKIIGVMGIENKPDVTLIRHAYVRTIARNKGIGGKLLDHLSELTTKPILIGTWADAIWAINFYKKRGFNLLPRDDGERLLQKYWTIPARQIETSVVLANSNWTI
jgi:N-acetylglutamate synthase-like GNAT family acetyltransferase